MIKVREQLKVNKMVTLTGALLILVGFGISSFLAVHFLLTDIERVESDKEELKDKYGLDI